MGRKISLRYITGEYFNCGLCSKIVKKPVECKICERLFCERCMAEFVKYNNYICPNHCSNPELVRAGHAFEKLMGFVYSTCKYTGCRHQDCIKNIQDHEEICRHKNLSLDIETSDEIAERDHFWMQVLNKVLTPSSQGTGMQNINPNLTTNTPRVHNFIF